MRAVSAFFASFTVALCVVTSSARGDAPSDFAVNAPLIARQSLRALSLGGDEATLGSPALIAERSGTGSFVAGHFGADRVDVVGPSNGNLATLSVTSPDLVARGWAIRATFLAYDDVGVSTIESPASTDVQSTSVMSRAAILEACGRWDVFRFGVLAGYAGTEATLRPGSRTVLTHIDYDGFPLGAALAWSPSEEILLGAQVAWTRLSEDRTPAPDDRVRSTTDLAAGLSFRPNDGLLLDAALRDVVDERGSHVGVSCGAEFLLSDLVRVDAGVRGSTFTAGLGFPVGDALFELMVLGRDGAQGEQVWLGDRSIGVFGAITVRHSSPRFR